MSSWRFAAILLATGSMGQAAASVQEEGCACLVFLEVKGKLEIKPIEKK